MPAEILRGSANLLTHVADPAARSIVLGCCAALVLGAFRVRTVAIRAMVWRGVLVAALAMPLLGLLVIPVRVPVKVQSMAKYVAATPPSAAEARAAGSAPHAAATETGARVVPSRIARVRTGVESSGPALRSKTTSFAPPIVDVPARNEASSSSALAGLHIPWLVLTVAVYVGLMIIFLVRIWLGIRFAHKLETNAATIYDEQALAASAVAAHANGLKAAPRLAESEMLSVPVTLGISRPVILFPGEWREWEAGELEAVLAHEISHVARRDALVQRLAMIHRAIFWFSPFAWWLERHLADLSEQASDEAALAMGADRTRYAETLLGFFATLEAAPQRVWWQGVSMAKLGQAERRVDRILAWRGVMSKGVKKSLMLGLAVVAAPAVILTASVHPTVNNFQDPVVAPEQQVQSAPAPAQRPSSTVPPQAAAAPAPSNVPFVPPMNDDATPEAPFLPAVAPTATMGSETPVAAIAPVAPMAPLGFGGQTPMAPPMYGNSDEVRQAYEAMRQAQESLIRAKEQMTAANEEAAEAANEGQKQDIKRAKEEYKAAMASYQKDLKRYNACVAEAREIAEQAQAIVGGVSGGAYGGVSGGAYGGVSGGVGSQSYIYNHTSDWGPRFVIVTKNSSDVTMSGTEEDAEHARSLKNKISGDFIWFERDEKSYVITDAGFVSKAKALFAPQEELAKKQEELGRQQDELGKQQDALGKQMDEVKVKIPDITPDLERVRSELDALHHQEGVSQMELGRLQRELGELQREIGRYQSDAGRQQGDIGRQQGDLGRKQGELGRQQGELGRQEGEIARKASRELREMFSEAIDKGLAKPE